MNYSIYAKGKDDKRFHVMNLSTGEAGVKRVYATLIPDLEQAKARADNLAKSNPGVIFQVRTAGTARVIYTAPVC